MHSYFETFSTNMPTAQQKKGTKNLSHTAQIREALLYVIIDCAITFKLKLEKGFPFQGERAHSLYFLFLIKNL